MEIKEIKKEWLKNEGASIKELRKTMKEEQRENGYSWKQSDLEYKKTDYRNEHIAYSMAKGNKYEDIERTVREDNEPNWYRIGQILLNEYGIDLKDIK